MTTKPDAPETAAELFNRLLKENRLTVQIGVVTLAGETIRAENFLGTGTPIPAGWQLRILVKNGDNPDLS